MTNLISHRPMIVPESRSVLGQILAKADPTRPLPSQLLGAQRLGDTDWYQVQLPEGQSTEEALDSYSLMSGVTEVVPNHLIRLEDTASSAPSQWALERIGAQQAWSKSQGQGVTVAVLDTGMDTSHPALAGNLWTNPKEVGGNGVDDDSNGFVDDLHGANTVERNGDVGDGGEHGTHVAGIVGADGDSVKGVAPAATLMPIKIFDNNGNTDVASVIEAFHYATENGARVLNCSWGGAPYNQALFEAMRDTDALIVCSAGNRGHDNDLEPHYPSGFDLPNVLAVAATNRDDGLSFISNYGSKTVDIAAPGVQILSTVPKGGYEGKSGTSMAAPHVSGAAALLASLSPAMSPRELKAQLLESAHPLAGLTGKVASGGLLNLPAALAERPASGHGPQLLGDFYDDFLAGLQELDALDNTSEDADLRPGFLAVGRQRVILGEGRLALREQEGRTEQVVFMEGTRQGQRLTMSQRGFEQHGGRYYEYPLHLDGTATTPFDPPDAEVSDEATFERANQAFQDAWKELPPSGQAVSVLGLFNKAERAFRRP